jgi:hypothetical protein
VAAVDPEIRVSRQEDGSSKRFGHANQARVGETLLLEQLHNWPNVAGKFEAHQQGTPAKQCAEIGAPRPPRRRKDSDRTASHVDQGGGNFGGLGHSPFVVIVPAAQQRHQKSRINENGSRHNLCLASTPSCGQ